MLRRRPSDSASGHFVLLLKEMLQFSQERIEEMESKPKHVRRCEHGQVCLFPLLRIYSSMLVSMNGLCKPSSFLLIRAHRGQRLSVRQCLQQENVTDHGFPSLCTAFFHIARSLDPLAVRRIFAQTSITSWSQRTAFCWQPCRSSKTRRAKSFALDEAQGLWSCQLDSRVWTDLDHHS